jgi:hypothetical protein
MQGVIWRIKKKLEVHLLVRKSEKLKPLAYASWNLEETEFEAVLWIGVVCTLVQQQVGDHHKHHLWCILVAPNQEWPSGVHVKVAMGLVFLCATDISETRNHSGVSWDYTVNRKQILNQFKDRHVTIRTWRWLFTSSFVSPSTFINSLICLGVATVTYHRSILSRFIAQCTALGLQYWQMLNSSLLAGWEIMHKRTKLVETYLVNLLAAGEQWQSVGEAQETNICNIIGWHRLVDTPWELTEHCEILGKSDNNLIIRRCKE